VILTDYFEHLSSDPGKTEELDPAVPSAALLDAKSSALEAQDRQRNEVGKSAQSAKSLKDDWKPTALANLPDNYEVISLIGEGGMGAVYKVNDKRLNKPFAVKILRPELIQNKSAVNRFEQESKAEKLLTHVNLVSGYDYGVGEQGVP
jgi:serine/threonine protein kinase